MSNQTVLALVTDIISGLRRIVNTAWKERAGLSIFPVLEYNERIKGGTAVARSRVGILGGSFNPIHRRHLQIAMSALQEMKLDRVLLIPNGNPPHKHTELASAAHRYEMTRLAAMPYESFCVSDVEMNRVGIVYAVDTLKLLHKQYPDADLFYIIGEDTLFDLEHWVMPLEVFSQCSFIVCLRQHASLAGHPYVERIRQKGAVIHFLSLSPFDISASDIRRQIAQGVFNDAMMTPEVIEYIRIMRLYGSAPALGGADAAYPMLKEDLCDDRLLHSLAVAYTANRLALIHHLDVEGCEMAALLHDCAKCVPLSSMQRIASDHRLELSETELYSAGLLHGPVGAVVAREKYGVTRQDILTAIACHTTGYVGMSEMDIVVFLADKIEPYRNDIPELNEIRTLASDNLYQAAYRMLRCSVAHVAQTKRPLHPETENILQWLLEFAQ